MVAATVAVCIELPTKIVRRTIDKDTAVPYGTLMKLGDANTVVVSAANSDPFGGICTFEKLATDTDITEIPCAMDGVWDISTTAAAITSGAIVSIGGANQVAVSVGTADQVAGSNVGQAEETRSDATDRIRVRLRG